MIRAAEIRDAAAIAAIYNHYVAQTVITFEETAVADTEMAGRIESVSRRYPWLVRTADDRVVGYAYASAWQQRSAYRFCVETTVYCDPAHLGAGIGTQLYAALLDAIRERGFHCAVAGIALPNAASIALHEAFGYRKVAEFHEVGFKLGRWIDVGYWELSL